MDVIWDIMRCWVRIHFYYLFNMCTQPFLQVPAFSSRFLYFDFAYDSSKPPIEMAKFSCIRVIVFHVFTNYLLFRFCFGVPQTGYCLDFNYIRNFLISGNWKVFTWQSTFYRRLDECTVDLFSLVVKAFVHLLASFQLRMPNAYDTIQFQKLIAKTSPFWCCFLQGGEALCQTSQSWRPVCLSNSV